MGGHDGGAKGDVVGAVVPLVVGAGEQIFDIEEFVVGDAQLLEVEVDPAGLLVVGIEVDDGEDDVGRAAVDGGSGQIGRASCRERV